MLDARAHGQEQNLQRNYLIQHKTYEGLCVWGSSCDAIRKVLVDGKIGFVAPVTDEKIRFFSHPGSRYLLGG